MASMQEALFSSSAPIEATYFYPSSKFPYADYYRTVAHERTAALFKNTDVYLGKSSQEFAREFKKRLEDAFSDPTAYFGVYLEDSQPKGVVTLFPRKEFVHVFELQVSTPSRYKAIARILLHNAEQNKRFKGKIFYGVIHKSNPLLHEYLKDGCSESPRFFEDEHPQWRKEDGWVGLVYPSLLRKKETHYERIKSITESMNAGKEAIQDTTGLTRPVFVIRDDAVVNEPEKWRFTELMFTPYSAIEELNKKLRCIGAVETAEGELIGTCWLIYTGYVCTNKHVAAEFYEFTADGEVTGTIESPMVNFKREHGRSDDPAHRFAVDKLVYVDPNVDLAILKLRGYTGTDYLVLEDAPFDEWKNLVEDEVFVVGYPGRDAERNPERLMVKIFGEIYEKKRLAFGKLTDYRKGEVFYHSASTLGGNSGSPVLGINSMKVLGLHFGGLFNANNRCVAFPKLQTILKHVIATNQ